MIPLVSILIPAYNAAEYIGQTIASALAQTWKRKEIIVLDDGSTDRTAEVARTFKDVTFISTENRGFPAAQNYLFECSQGDYIQYLDADDLLMPNKIERQLAALRDGDSTRTLLSSPWAYFYYRIERARFIPNSLWQDLSPVDWLLRKMRENLHMQNATWLVPRELAATAGPWDTRLQYDQDGEFFARVLLASEGTRFVETTGIYYRSGGMNRISFIGSSDTKKDSLLLSMKLHVQYLRSLEDSERVRKASLAYLQNWYAVFYPERPDCVGALQDLAADLQGRLEVPKLRWKYAWLQPVCGYQRAKRLQLFLPHFTSSLNRSLDRALFGWENGRHSAT